MIKDNIQNHIEVLFTLYPQTEVSNANISGTTFDSAITALQADYEANKLSAEELALSGVTVQRIEVQDQINRGIYAVRHAYMISLPKTETPSWLIKEGFDIDIFEEFFAQLPSINTKTQQHLAIEGVSIESLQTLYTQWAELVAQEELDKQTQEKVRSLVDIRRVLVAMVAYKGMPIRAVMENAGMKEAVAA